MEFEDPAADALEALYKEGPAFLIDRVDQALDQLERDPTQAAVRRHRFQVPPLWAFTVHIHNYEWAILWRLHDDEIVVSYIGPSTF